MDKISTKRVLLIGSGFAAASFGIVLVADFLSVYRYFYAPFYGLDFPAEVIECLPEYFRRSPDAISLSSLFIGSVAIFFASWLVRD